MVIKEGNRAIVERSYSNDWLLYDLLSLKRLSRRGSPLASAPLLPHWRRLARRCLPPRGHRWGYPFAARAPTGRRGRSGRASPAAPRPEKTLRPAGGRARSLLCTRRSGPSGRCAAGRRAPGLVRGLSGVVVQT